MTYSIKESILSYQSPNFYVRVIKELEDGDIVGYTRNNVVPIIFKDEETMEMIIEIYKKNRIATWKFSAYLS